MRIFINLLLLIICINGFSQLQKLKVSDNNRFLVREDGTPFFWLGDTGWELFHRLSKDDATYYLRNRAGKGFNIIQCVLLAENNGLTEPTPEGYVPFLNLDPAQPNEDYFSHVDWVLDKAEEFGLYLAILPTWGSHVEDRAHPLFENHAVFNEQNAEAYGEFLGDRYKDRTNLIWVLGGDRAPDGYEEIWESMARGIKNGGSDHLMTYHIYGGRSSSEYWHDSDWLDFNMIQSGHTRAFDDNYRLVTIDYKKTPIKPVLDGEQIYEDIPIGFKPANGRTTEHLLRVTAYWSVLAGGFGSTYDHNSIWQMYDHDKTPVLWAEVTWEEALHFPGSFQMKHLKNLMLSRPFLTRIPDQSIILNNPDQGVDHPQATRDGSPRNNDATYLMVYFPYLSINYDEINTRVINSEEIYAWWYDPRTGNALPIGEFDNTGTFNLPWVNRLRENDGGPDWVLVIDDTTKNYPAPGEYPEGTDSR